MPREAAAELLAGVSADRLADIFRQVKEPHCSELLDLLDPDTRVGIRRLLVPKDTAGSIMTTEFASVPSPADTRLYPSRGKQPGNRLRDLRAGSPQQEAG
jgi:Mg/Co/Ni transporter MgtE